MASKLMKSHRTVVILSLLVLIAIIYYFVIRKNEGFRGKVSFNDSDNVGNFLRKYLEMNLTETEKDMKV